MSKFWLSCLLLFGTFVISSASFASEDPEYKDANQCLIYLDSESWKLIRDDLPEIFERENDPVELAYIDGDLYTDFLMKKVGEELLELSSAISKVETEEEMADLMEVVLAIQKHLGLDPEVVEQIRLKKRAKKGGFERGVIMRIQE